jgi:hydrogenase-4 membrane subunit HyfE
MFDQSAVVMSYLLIIIALWISATRTITLMVRLYQTQAIALTGVVLITAVEPGRSLLALGLVAILPVSLAAIVPPLLARATYNDTTQPAPAPEVGAGELLRSMAARRQPLKDAEWIWLQHGGSRLPASMSAAIDLFLIATSVLVAYRLPVGNLPPGIVPSLAVSIALLLQGLFTMINKNDIISQVIGLLVVDQGLFLAAVRVAPPALANLFVVSLFLYVLVTLIILLWVLPGLHQTSASIEVVANTELRG